MKSKSIRPAWPIGRPCMWVLAASTDSAFTRNTTPGASSLNHIYLDDAIEIELQSGGNLLRHDRITLLGAGGLGPLADAQNLHCHVSEVEGLSAARDVALDLAHPHSVS